MPELIDKIWLGNASLANTVVHPLQAGYDEKIQRYPYDPAKAKQLMQQAGLGSGFETNLYLYADVAIAEALQGYLAEIGIKATLKDYRTNSGALTEIRRGGKIDALASLHWGTSTVLDADQQLYPWFHSSGPDSYGNSPEVDALLDDARKTLDTGKRNELYSKAQKTIMDQAWWVPLYYKDQIDAVDKDLVYEVPFDEQIVYRIPPGVSVGQPRQTSGASRSGPRSPCHAASGAHPMSVTGPSAARPRLPGRWRTMYA